MRLWGDNVEALRIASGTIFNEVANLSLWWIPLYLNTFCYWIEFFYDFIIVAEALVPLNKLTYTHMDIIDESRFISVIMGNDI